MNAPVESMLSDQLLGRAGFHARGAGDHLRAHQRRDGDIHGARQFRIRRATDSDGDRAQPPGFGHRAQHVRRAPAGGDAHQHVARREAARGQVARAHGGIVLGGFGGAAQGGLAAGDDALHHLRAAR